MIIKELKPKLKEIGFIEYKNKNYNKGYFIKEGKYPFQIAILQISISSENLFSAYLSFDIKVKDGISLYIEPWRKEKQERFSYYQGRESYHTYHINNNEIINNHDYKNLKSERYGFSNIESFIDLLSTEGIKVVEKYLNPFNNIDYLLNNYQKYELKSYAKIISILYEQLGDKENALNYLLKHYDTFLKIMREDEKKLYSCYIDYLKKNIPLPKIKNSNDPVTVFQATGNDIYIAINKNLIKDINLLEYFGGIEKFKKSQKVDCDEILKELGVVISKIEKWSILHLSIEIFSSFDESDMNNFLSNLSDKYKRAILFINQDVSKMFGFEVYKEGQPIRKWMIAEGEVFKNEGKPIGGENKKFTDTAIKIDENDIILFLDTIIKITYNDLSKCKSNFYALKQHSSIGVR